MDGRVGAIREALDDRGFETTPILAYSAKYASAFYGPFREAADSTPAFGDRRGYQMDPANVREALRECELDLDEGADAIMIKPALPYLDVIRAAREAFDVPIAAYNVSRRVRDGQGGRARRLARRARGRARVADRDQARRRRPDRQLLDARPSGVALTAAFRSLPARARADPRRRQLARARDARRRPRRAALRRARRGRVPRDRRRPPLPRLGHVVGAARSSGHADAETVEAVREAALRGTTFGAPTEARGRARRGDRRRRAVGREGAARLVRHRGRDERAAPRARVHEARPHPQVRRRLPRPRRRAARERRLRPRDARHPGLARRADAASPPTRSSCPYNDVDAVAEAVDALRRRASRRSSSSRSRGTWASSRPRRGFLEALRRLCDASGALLVFDEVITGFRVARGGAQERYGVTPDLTVLGKIVGGGLPLAAFGGRADVMDLLAPAGPVYQAGTLSGNPLATAAGLSVLRRLRDPAVYEELERTAARLEDGLAPFGRVQRVGALLTLFMTDAPVRNFEDAQALRHRAVRRALPPSARAAASTSRRRSSRRCSSRSRTATRRSSGRSRRR